MWLHPLRVPAYAFPPGYSWRHYRSFHDAADYVRIVNTTLSGHWGVEPITLDSVASLVRQPAFHPANILFATWGREIVGVSAQRFIERQVNRHPLTATHIGPVGVSTAHRGLGLGHALVAASLAQARRRNIQAAELDVDEGNGPAIHVYQDCGLEILTRIFWYRRLVEA